MKKQAKLVIVSLEKAPNGIPSLLWQAGDEGHIPLTVTKSVLTVANLVSRTCHALNINRISAKNITLTSDFV